MADPSRYPVGSADDTGAGSDRRPNAGTPSWVKAFVVVAVVAVLLFVASQVVGGGGHGPGRHVGGVGDRAPLARRP